MTDKTREDFHSWMRDRFWVGVNLVRSPDGYVSTVSHPSLPMTYASVEMMWESYQAATQHSAARIAELEAEVQALSLDAFAKDASIGQGMERAAEICESIAREDYGMTDLHEYGECAEAIRAHAQNQPKTTHDTGNVSKN